MQEHPEVDVVIVGTGWAGSIVAQQLTQAGLEVVAVERGRAQWTWPDFAHNHDYLKFNTRQAMMQDLSKETWTWRPNRDAPTLPMREHGGHRMGTDLGGSGVHWSTISWRFLPMDFRYRSHHIERYGEEKLPEGNTIQDWPISYADLEPFYDRFEYDIGMSGQAGNLGGQIIEGGNPFEGPRSRPYPLPAMSPMIHGKMYADACRRLGYHPFMNPSSILSRGYTDASGKPRAGCLLCGYCSGFGCEVDAKGSPLTTFLPMAMDTGRYEVRTHSTAVGVEVDDRGLATGLRYVDRTGREHLQPAARVFLCGFTFSNVRQLLLSRSDAHPDGLGNNQGMVGRNYTHQMIETPVSGMFEGRRFNQFMGNTATRVAICDFYGDVFDHTDLDFIGGAFLAHVSGESDPIDQLQELPLLGAQGSPSGEGGDPAQADEDEPRQWGQAYKDGLFAAYNSTITLQIHAEDMAYESRFLDLDPRYTDSLGLPLLRLTYDWTQNEHNMHRYLTERLVEIMEAMEPDEMSVNRELEGWGISQGGHHPTGGAIMGTDPSNSVTNGYGQVWQAPNVFVTGAALFPQNPGFNPTETVAALAYRSCAAIIERHLDSPEELMG